MKEICENIYKKSRKNAGFEQVEAADRLGVSARSLQNYESRVDTLPPMDVVRNMVYLYRDIPLAHKFVKLSPLGEFFPDFTEYLPLSVATLTMLDDLYAVQGCIAELIKVTKDGTINANESEFWLKFCDLSYKLTYSLYSLINNPKGAGISVD